MEGELGYASGPTLGLGFILSLMTASPLAHADTVVNVLLQDATSGSNMTGMKMTVTPDSVKAGRVTIRATNQSLGLVHEVIVVRPPTNGTKLPYDDKTGRVIEKRINDVGDVSDLPPGKSGSLTLTLTPGNYLLICNQPNHYQAGMWTKLTVTR
jgi:uncharacterized cupredoxin-like copper-binding protein